MKKEIANLNYQCGGTCINGKKNCYVKGLSDNTKNLASSLVSTIDGTKPTFNNNNVLAEGNFGRVTLSDDGNVVKKELLETREGNEWGSMEVELGKKMGEAGYAPKLYPGLTNEKQIVMDVAPGAPLWKDFRQAEGEPTSMSEEAGKKALEGFLYLHKDLGAYHGDAHVKQLIVDKDDVKIIDFGLSGKIEGDDGYKKATTDIRKIRKNIGLERFVEESGVVGEIARLFTEDKEIKGSSKKAKAAKQETVDKYREILER